ncbi:phosphopentomutase [Streptococcus pneumoniae]|uniref:Phosphopentomutase n=1 Tax=Streptococcus pneumoniae TaxID=1313 RepID=A0AA86XTI0_STREE|nr:phosphopentomutase [Streptococcus pneumoniae]CIS80032.1 phosphopentomutase [Streptococcus pneumoniae]CJV54927.1 phosphopentomutase [Streptococcus pneumoniae]CJW94466.1 phosphopentomutase [Streptococcus pneumoniae]
MTRYALLVRGINVGGKNKVVMAELRQELTDLGLEKVESYINGGNIFFTSTVPKVRLVEKLEAFFEVHYPFIQSFSLLNQEGYEAEVENLPAWWNEDLARKDVLFYTELLDVEQVITTVESLELKDEVVHFGKLGIFWGKFSEESYSKTAYHKYLLKVPFYRHITIRNAKTFDKIGQMLKK